MELVAALSEPEFAKDAATFDLVASIESAGVFPTASTVPFEADLMGRFDPHPTDEAPPAKLVIALVASIFAIIGVLAGYLLVT